MTASLHDVAPRLAVARDVDRFNVWTAGDDYLLGLKNGDRWAETVRADHETSRCSCDGTIDRYDILRRILVGPNRGALSRVKLVKCRQCSSSWMQVR